MYENLLLVGPTCIGKRVTNKHLKSVFGEKIETIETGQLAREQFEKDTAFKEQYLSFPLAGKLIPDHAILPLAEARIAEINAISCVTYRCFDGIPRSVSQLDFLVDNDHVSTEDTIVVFLHGTRATCRRRFDHRYNTRPTGQRIDEIGEYEKELKKFNDRYTLHQEEYPAVRAKARKLGFRIHDVDANKDLDVFPLDVVAIVKASWLKTTLPVTPAPSRSAREIVHGVHQRRIQSAPRLISQPQPAMAFGK